MAITAMSGSVKPDDSLLQHLIQAIKAAAVYNRNAVAKPRVILWPDKEKQWQGLIPALSAAMPELWMALRPEEELPQGCRGGVATQLRYDLQRDTRPEVAGEIPVIYLPGIERADFRSPETFPTEHRHLYAFCHLGTFFAPKSGRDWTPVGFLSSTESAIGLEVPGDNKTKTIVLRHLLDLFNLSPMECRGKVLNAETLMGLFTPDPVRVLLEWIGQGDKLKAQWGEARWASFLNLAQTKFHFYPQQDGQISAAEKLVEGGGIWDEVWTRFCESPRLFSAILPVLDRVLPKTLFSATRIPSHNFAKEKELAKELGILPSLACFQAQNKLASLVQAHRERAIGPWADLGQAPLAKAVVRLGEMLHAMEKSINATDWEVAAKGYLEYGWQVDKGARTAIAATANADNYHVVTLALQGVYKPWLADLAERLQKVHETYPLRHSGQAISQPATPGTLILFVDGLRADVALEFALLLEKSGLKPVTELAWAALPTVTATAKPAFQPVAGGLCGDAISESFEPVVQAKNKPCRTEEFRTLLKQNGFAVLSKDDNGDPSQAAWLEAGNLDKLGHSEGGKLARRVDEELQGLAHKVLQLLHYGWREIRVVTDHGWLWLPGGLPHVEMPGHLTASKWGRCALAKTGALHGMSTVPWFWGNEYDVVVPPGIGVFIKNTEYSHGGLSLQECLKVHLTITNPGKTGGQVRIVETRWANLRLKLKLDGAKAGLVLDVRAKAADPASSLLLDKQPVTPDESGHATLFADDDMSGHGGFLVVIDNGQVVAKQQVTVGENN